MNTSQIKKIRLQTGISQAAWCQLGTHTAYFEDAKIAFGREEARPISWFDNLFEKGILLLDKAEGRPLTFLITGPPGSGKTTLALEMCYRLAKNEENLNFKKFISLYISTDTDTDQLITNANSFGWEDTDQYIFPASGIRPPLTGYVAVWGRDQIKDWSTISDIVGTALRGLTKWIIRASPETIIRRIQRIFDFLPFVSPVDREAPDILVVDNLNVVEPEKRADFFDQFLKIASRGTKMVILVLDSGFGRHEHKTWEYICDIVLRVDSTYEDDYYIRTIEIIKARYQTHVWGKHQLKIYAKPAPIDPGSLDFKTRMRRAHPYRQEGGIFIYPSIHYYLSKYKRRSSTEPPKLIDTLPEKLNDIVQFPEGRCTAFIGNRGGHKSHLGYLHLLHRLMGNKQMEENEGALIVSLRDDEEMTKRTIRKILVQEFGVTEQQSNEHLARFEQENRLEILYYPPGYITPEEFFHRMMMSIHRLRCKSASQPSTKLTLMFNSLDQLSARFPLCAKQEIFIPGIIESLCGERVTSIFIAVDEPGQPVEQYGLLPMADLILSFYRHRFDFIDYYNHITTCHGLSKRSDAFKAKAHRIKQEFDMEESHREEVILQVIRFAGGQKGGSRGLLELVDEKSLPNELHETIGLHFTTLSPMYSQGERIDKTIAGYLQ